MVYGVRRKRKESWPKRAAYHAYYRLLAAVADCDVPLDSGDFCLMDRAVVDAVLAGRDPSPFVRGLRAWAGFRQEALEYERAARADGESKYTPAKLAHLAVSGVVGCSTKPLRLAGYLGLVASATAGVGGVAALGRYFADRPVPGAAAAVLAALFVGGVQLCCLGILGEYVARIYEAVRGRPVAVVGETAGFADG